jgi:hypothetical protein
MGAATVCDLKLVTTWSQSYKTYIVLIKPFFWRNLRQFSTHKYWRGNNAIIYAKKMSFVVIPTAQNRFIELKKLFFLITPTPKFWCWRNYFYRIASRK